MSLSHKLGLVLLLTSPLTACEEPTGSLQPELARAESFRSTEIVDFSVPIYLGCLDQEVVWSGTVQYNDHWVILPDGTTRLNGYATLHPGSTLMGSSGTWSPTKVTSRYVHEFPADGDPGDALVVERITWENVASGQFMDVWVRYHVVIGGDGKVKRNEPYVHYCELRR